MTTKKKQHTVKDAERAISKTIEETLALGDTKYDQHEFQVSLNFGPNGELISHICPRTKKARELLARTVARVTAA